MGQGWSPGVACEVAVTWICQGLVSVYLEAIFILASQRIIMSSPLSFGARSLVREELLMKLPECAIADRNKESMRVR